MNVDDMGFESLTRHERIPSSVNGCRGMADSDGEIPERRRREAP